jgi:hypothetical protein
MKTGLHPGNKAPMVLAAHTGIMGRMSTIITGTHHSGASSRVGATNGLRPGCVGVGRCFSGRGAGHLGLAARSALVDHSVPAARSVLVLSGESLGAAT